MTVDIVVRTALGEAEVTVGAGEQPELTVGEVLGAVLGRAPRGPVAIDGREVPAMMPWPRAGVRRGSIVEVDRPAVGPIPPPGVELVTVAGVGAGRRRLLAPGRYRIGPGIGSHELADGPVRTVRWQLGVPAPAEVVAEQLVELDDRVIALRPVRVPTPMPDRVGLLAGPVDPDGTVAFNRPPRRTVSADDPPIVVPEASRRRDDARSIPVMALLAPLPLAVGMAAMMGSWRFALFGLLSPVMMLANVIEERRHQRRSGCRAARADARAVAAVSAEIAGRHRVAHDAARRDHPHLGDLLARLHDADPRLWERRADHDDAFVIPIGWGDQPWRAQLERRHGAVDVSAALADHSVLRGVPVTVDLAAGGGLGIVGDRDRARAVARAVVLAAAALHGPADLTVVVCADAEAADAWDWSTWLPHVRAAPARVLTDLRDDVVAREARRGPGADTGRPLLLVVADGPQWWHGRDAPLRRAAARRDVRMLALTTDEHLVPASCTAIARLSPSGRSVVGHVPSGTEVDHVALNAVELTVALATARRAARLDDPERHAGTIDTGPVPLLTTLGLEPVDAAAVHLRWADPDRGPRAPIGLAGDTVVHVDLVADGPHGLVAGTTGSGKSELLRTLVAGLAATLPPDELQVVLVDFKGGAAFDACARLPHTVGMVTDLDEHLAARMLRSLRAEITRRERRLRAAGVGSLDELAAAAGRGVLARLLIVIDEFGSLAAQLPSFVPGLIDIAQRGRSLGVHLVLATQRPAGVVDNKIRANTNLRIALRVHDDADSLDVVGTRDAATLPRRRPGRAVVRFGAGELIELQTALATAITLAGSGSGLRVEPRAVTQARSAVRRRLERAAASTAPTAPDHARATDLDRLVDAIAEAAGPVVLARPCLDPLPEVVRAPDLSSELERTAPGVPLALADLPDEQRRVVWTWQPGPTGSLALVGTTGSGTTSTLLALALGLAATHPPDAVQLYVVDADAGHLAPLATLPHVGAVVGVDDPDRIGRVIHHLGSEIDRRRRGNRIDSDPDRRDRGDDDEPTIVLLVDNIGSLRDLLGRAEGLGESWSGLERVVRDGAGVGVHAVLTASDERALGPALSAHLGRRLLLRLADRSAYTLFGLRGQDVPETMPPGRAIDPGTGVEAQLLAPPADVLGAVAAVVDRWPTPARPPRPIDPFPRHLRVEQVCSAARAASDGWHLPIGFDRRDGALVALALPVGGTIAVLGPAGSGRTSALRTLATSLAHADPNVARYAIGPQGGLADLAVAARDPGEVAGWVDRVLAGSGPQVVFVDDADELDGPSLVRLVTARGPLTGVVLAGTADRLRRPAHWARPLLRTRTGVLLAAGPGDGDLLRVTVPRRAGASAGGPGGAYAVLDGIVRPVLVADGSRAVAGAVR